MSVGRKKLPAHLHVLHGNPGHRPINKNEPKPDLYKDVPKPPKDVGLNTIGRKEWKRIAPILHSLKLLTKIDLSNFIGYCIAFQHYVTANKKIKKEGMIFINSKGIAHQSPYIYIAEKKYKEMKVFMTELGMSPTSRAKLQIKQSKDDDDLDNFIND